jgi:hypothetical protein
MPAIAWRDGAAGDAAAHRVRSPDKVPCYDRPADTAAPPVGGSLGPPRPCQVPSLIGANGNPEQAPRRGLLTWRGVAGRGGRPVRARSLVPASIGANGLGWELAGPRGREGIGPALHYRDGPVDRRPSSTPRPRRVGVDGDRPCPREPGRPAALRVRVCLSWPSPIPSVRASAVGPRPGLPGPREDSPPRSCITLGIRPEPVVTPETRPRHRDAGAGSRGRMRPGRTNRCQVGTCSG